MFYFADAPTLLRDLLTLTAHPVAFITIALLTATTFVFGGFMREQICIYACPWPRIQAAMLDEDSLTVSYRPWRGEPRGKGRERVDAGGTALGDCIDCNACVAVCPQGIDIRDGQQLACITCALCIDDCNAVMDKVGKPRSLIGYMALTDEVRERAGQPPKSVWRHVFRPRTVLYTGLWAGVGVLLVVALFVREPFGLSVAPVRNPVFVTLSDGSLRNAYDLRLRNQMGGDHSFRITIKSEVPLQVSLEGVDGLAVTVPADQTLQQRIYVTAPANSPGTVAHQTAVRVWVQDATGTDRVWADTIFNGAGQ